MRLNYIEGFGPLPSSILLMPLKVDCSDRRISIHLRVLDWLLLGLVKSEVKLKKNRFRNNTDWAGYVSPCRYILFFLFVFRENDDLDRTLCILQLSSIGLISSSDKASELTITVRLGLSSREFRRSQSTLNRRGVKSRLVVILGIGGCSYLTHFRKLRACRLMGQGSQPCWQLQQLEVRESRSLIAFFVANTPYFADMYRIRALRMANSQSD